MGPYTFCLALGATGLVAMALRGLGSHHHGSGHDAHHGDHGHAGHHGDGHGHAAPGHHGDHGHAGAGHHHQDHIGGAKSFASWLGLLSPRVIFSVLVGGGATGLLVRPFLFEPLVAIAAIGGGLIFERWIVGPLWRFLFRFESSTALTLEALLMDEANAVTGFNAMGEGLIAAELDGRIVQLLGRLSGGDRARGVRVRRGDRVRIEEVDPIRNQCVVSLIERTPEKP